MTKLPEVGKRYKCHDQNCDWLEFSRYELSEDRTRIGYCVFDRHHTNDENGTRGGYVNYSLEYFFANFEELPEEKEESSGWRIPLERLGIDPKTKRSIYEKDKVQVALEELKNAIRCWRYCGKWPSKDSEYYYVFEEAQNLVNALEDKQKQKPAMSNNSLEERIERLEKLIT